MSEASPCRTCACLDCSLVTRNTGAGANSLPHGDVSWVAFMVRAAKYAMAKLFEKEGRRSDAVRELQIAVRLEPDFEPANADLRLLPRS